MTPSDPKLIGVKNGIYQCEIIPDLFSTPEDYARLESQFGFIKYKFEEIQTPPEGFEFEYVKLLKKARITDIISYSPKLLEFQFILSSKAKGLLDGLNIDNCRFYPTKLYDHSGNRVSDNFFMLQTTFLGFEAINFEKSIFYYGSEILGKKYQKINSYGEFKKAVDLNPLLSTEHVSLKKEFINSDFIIIRLGGPFVSERLWDRWSNFGVTGIKVFERKTAIVE